MAKLRVLHISDLHVSLKHDWNQKVLVQRLLDDLRTYQEARRIDLIVFTGDLSFSGRLDELELGVSLLIQPLMTALDLNADRIVLVPGNHDVERGLVEPVYEAGLDRLLVERDAANTYMGNSASLQTANSRLDNWRRFCDTFYRGVDRNDVPPLGWTRKVTIDGTTIGILALNSAWRSTGAGDGERGHMLIGERQLLTALEKTEGTPLRIVAMHHPVDWLLPFDSDDVRREVERAGAVVLTGHEHISEPSSSFTGRGAALYAQVGCLYQTRAYTNSYAILDFDLEANHAKLTVRGWIKEQQHFDAAVWVGKNGVVELPLPRSNGQRNLPAVAFSDVTQGLVEYAQRSAVVADVLPNRPLNSVADLLVAPRLYPLPFTEVLATNAQEKAKPVERTDATALFNEHRIVIVSGEGESGVTSSLLWSLERQFIADASRIPLYVRFSNRQGLHVVNQDLRDAASHIGFSVEHGATMPPAVIAVDDVTMEHERRIDQWIQHALENPGNAYIFGCHGERHQQLFMRLEKAGLSVQRIFLAPFGRRELKQLVVKITGGPGGELPDRILSVLEDKHLPRSPFLMAALTAVMADQPEAVLLNPTAIIDAYINLMLGRLELTSEQGMDFRTREHLLEHFAGHLTDRGATGVDRLAAEEVVAEYFQSRDMRRASPGHVLDDLIGRRLLMDDGLRISFRHPTLQHLFAAKLTADDSQFAERVRMDLIGHQEIIRHAAALSRSDRGLLAAVGDFTNPLINQHSQDVTEERVEALLAVGHEGVPTDVEHLEQTLNRTRPPSPQELDARLDEMYEKLGSEEAVRHSRASGEYDSVELELASTDLLSSVVVSMELVADSDLRTSLFKQAIRGWSAGALAMLRREEDQGTLREILERLVNEPLDDDDKARLSRILQLALMLTLAIAVSSSLGQKQIEGVLIKVLEDEEFMSSAIHALLCTLLAVQLKLLGWPQKLIDLDRAHGKHRFVADLAQDVAMNRFQSVAVNDDDAAILKPFLVKNILAAGGAAKGVEARQEQRSRIEAELQRSRTRAKLIGNTGDLLVDTDDRTNGDSQSTH